MDRRHPLDEADPRWVFAGSPAAERMVIVAYIRRRAERLRRRGRDGGNEDFEQLTCLSARILEIAADELERGDHHGDR